MEPDFSISRAPYGGFVVLGRERSGFMRELLCAGSLKACMDFIEGEYKDGAGIKRKEPEDAPR